MRLLLVRSILWLRKASLCGSFSLLGSSRDPRVKGFSCLALTPGWEEESQSGLVCRSRSCTAVMECSDDWLHGTHRHSQAKCCLVDPAALAELECGGRLNGDAKRSHIT